MARWAVIVKLIKEGALIFSQCDSLLLQVVITELMMSSLSESVGCFVESFWTSYTFCFFVFSLKCPPTFSVGVKFVSHLYELDNSWDDVFKCFLFMWVNGCKLITFPKNILHWDEIVQEVSSHPAGVHLKLHSDRVQSYSSLALSINHQSI